MKFCWFFLISNIFFSCHNNRSNTADIRTFYINELNSLNVNLRKADSLRFYLQLDSAIICYNNIIKSEGEQHIKQRAEYELLEMKYQFPFLYQKIELNYTDQFDSINYGFFYKLRNDPNNINLSQVNQMMKSDKPIHTQVKGNLYKSFYLNMELDNDLNSIFDYARSAYDLLKPYGYNHQLGLLVINQLQRASRYHRESLLGLSIINKYLRELSNYKIDEDIIDLLKINKGNLYIDLEESLLSKTIFDQIENNYLNQPCHDHYHRALIGKLYLGLYFDDSTDLDSIISKLLKTNGCLNRLSNIERWISSYVCRNDIRKSISILKSAKEFEHTSSFKSEALLESIKYDQSIQYQKLGDYQNALECYWSRPNDPYSHLKLLELEPFKNIWVVFERFASIHFSKWQRCETVDDLYTCISLLHKAESTAGLLMNSSDESTLLNYKYYQDLIYQSLTKAYYDLYDKSGSAEHQMAIVENLSKRKNLLMITDILNSQNQKKIPKSIIQEKNKKEKQIAEITQKYNYDHSDLLSLLWSLDSLNNRISGYNNSTDDFYHLKTRMNINEIQSYLEDRSLLSYSIIDNMLFIALIGRDSVNVYKKKFDIDMETKINTLTRLQSNPSISPADYISLAQDCYEILFPEELTSLLNEQLIIVPDGRLNYLSFEALIDNADTPSKENPSIPSYLIYRYDITSLPSEQLLNKINNHDGLNKNSKAAIFSFSDKESIINSKYLRLKELPWAYEEAKVVAQKFKNNNTCLGSNASVSNFLKTLEQPNDLIHVATHGISSSNSIYDVKLYFRNPDYSIDSLYGYELLDINIASKLIILSSCQSGTGTQTQGEGVYDLKRYLLTQGAKNVIASLWDLDDKSTFEIMQNFYTQDHPDLREAKIQYLLLNPSKAMPYYWAGLY